jgi:conjugative relaxase-like TrwC/TraI family protein
MLPGASPRKLLGSPAAVLTVAPLASGQAHYYLSLTASAYYTQAPEPEGTWYGLGAEEFGLKGTVKPDDLTRLCEGYDPQNPSRHVRNAGQNEGPRARKHGDDLYFSAPKSVSVAWALASPELREAIQAQTQQSCHQGQTEEPTFRRMGKRRSEGCRIEG